jgi:hypothetical protein
MKKFKVTIDKDEVIEDVVGWTTPGDFILLELADHSWRGCRGFVDFVVETVPEQMQ